MAARPAGNRPVRARAQGSARAAGEAGPRYNLSAPVGGAPVRPTPPGLGDGVVAAAESSSRTVRPADATMQARLGPVGLGHRHQLGHLDAVTRAFADQGGPVLVAVAGGGSHRQPQPMAGRCRP